jgi:rhodanese-related sulfurtransferase
MFVNIIAVTAIILGLVGLFMTWLANRKNQDLIGRLDRVNERVSSLQNMLAVEQGRVEQTKSQLQTEIIKLGGNPVRLEQAQAEPEPPPINEISPAELQARLDQGHELVVVDMRQLFEYKSGHIPGAINIFVNDIPVRANELPKDKDIVFQCWHGNTSLQAAAYLIDQGWPAERLASLSGGIAGWSQSQGMASLIREES